MHAGNRYYWLLFFKELVVNVDVFEAGSSYAICLLSPNRFHSEVCWEKGNQKNLAGPE